MIEYINSFLLLTLLGIIYYIYYKYKIFLRAINIDGFRNTQPGKRH